MGDQDLNYGLTPSDDAYRDYELIGDAETVLATLRSLTAGTPVTDIVHSGPAAGIDVRSEAYNDLKRFAEAVLPELKTW
jgi:hypothetical protein